MVRLHVDDNMSSFKTEKVNFPNAFKRRLRREK